MLPAQISFRRATSALPGVLCCLWAAALLSGPLAAQEGPSVLSLIPTEGRSLSVGQEVEGELRASDYVGYNGNHLQAWEIRGRAGQSVVVELLSDPLDPYLSVVGPGMDGALTDDDGGEGLNSRLCFSFPETGTYRIVASALGQRTGPFTLSVRESMNGQECDEDDAWFGDYSALEALSTDGRRLPVAGEVAGELDSGDAVAFDAPAEAWALEGRAGQSVSVDLLSDDFDAYLYLLGPGLDPIEDDDGAGACHSRITVTLPETGTYRVVASSLGGSTGGYTLTVGAEPGPVLDEPCGGFDDYWDEDDQVLRDLPFTGTLALGQPVDGFLDAGDPTFRGAYVQAWALEGRAGQTVAIDLTSDELDTYLFLLGPGFEDLVSDDDGGDEVNSRLCAALPETGTYRVVASTFSDEEPGPYRLVATTVAGPGEPGACDFYAVSMERFIDGLPTAGRSLRVGDVEPGELDREDARDPTDGSFVEAWALPLEAGEEVTVDMVSDEFDTYLFLAGPGIDGYTTDDDGAGACSARLTVTASEGGTYRVVASSFSSDATGGYEMHVTREPGPERDGPCPGGMDMDMGFGEPDEAELAALPVMGTVSPGYEHEGTLSDGDPVLADGYAHAWELHGNAGESLAIELISEEFDSYLYMTGPGVGLLSDDDDAGNLDSRIEVTLPETGTYRIVVTTFGDYGTGAYRLRILRSR